MDILQKMMDAVSKAINNALGVSLSDMLIQIGATLILVLVVRYFFWNHIRDFIRKRRELMEEEFTSAQQANEEAKLLQEKTEQEYQKLKESSKGIIDGAVKRGEEEREIIVNKAKVEAQEMLTQAENEIELDKQKARNSLQKEVVDLATLMASKIIEEEIDDKKYHDLATDKIERSDNA